MGSPQASSLEWVHDCETWTEWGLLVCHTSCPEHTVSLGSGVLCPFCPWPWGEEAVGLSKPATLAFAGLDFNRCKDCSEAINTKIWEKWSRILCTTVFLLQIRCSSDDPDLRSFLDSQMQCPQSVLSLCLAPQLFANLLLLSSWASVACYTATFLPGPTPNRAGPWRTSCSVPTTPMCSFQWGKFFPCVSILSHIPTHPHIGLIFFLLVKHVTLMVQLVLTPLTSHSFLFTSDLALTNFVGDRCIIWGCHTWPSAGKTSGPWRTI